LIAASKEGKRADVNLSYSGTADFAALRGCGIRSRRKHRLPERGIRLAANMPDPQLAFPSDL